MKLLVAVILTSILAFIAGLYLPWWSIAIVGFFVALLIPQFSFKAFMSGFLGIFILWAAIALWIDTRNQSILSKKIAELFHLGNSSLLLVLVTAFIGGLIGGFAALTGSFLRNRR